jgi:hypothetical protein
LNERGTAALIVPEADTAVLKGEPGRATGLKRPARELFDRVEHGHVEPLYWAP